MLASDCGLDATLRGLEAIENRDETAMRGVESTDDGLETGVGGGGAAMVRLETVDCGDETSDGRGERGEVDDVPTVDGTWADRRRDEGADRGDRAAGGGDEAANGGPWGAVQASVPDGRGL